ncbi:MAG TPA: DNA-primase RepB domain-containing protein, partial [Thermomicrobiales bacterium]|nr:DNA-primase RepB domain-containing protein [Thermomicrobiales bacterium]
MRAQLAALRAARYEIGVRDADGRLLPLTLTAAEIERRLGYFRALNARGSDLYLRPAGSTGLVFVDDLTREALARLRADGVAPAVVVESSPG